jgi:hypothetical protein
MLTRVLCLHHVILSIIVVIVIADVIIIIVVIFTTVPPYNKHSSVAGIAPLSVPLCRVFTKPNLQQLHLVVLQFEEMTAGQLLHLLLPLQLEPLAVCHVVDENLKLASGVRYSPVS